MRIKLSALILSFLAVIVAPVAALAGGPLFVDPITGQAYKYGPGVVPVYTDLGPLGKLSNEGADLRVVNAAKQWTDVATSSFEAQVAGDFASIGLPDINSTNARSVIGTYNGGGVHVIYDTDAKILQNILGAPSNVLGVATPEWTESEDSDVVTESWVVLNGTAVNTQAQADSMKGVITHEFGHAIGLAHSQTNGAIVNYFDSKGPAGCATLPYSGTPTVNDIETMYPVISVAAGVAMSTVDVADDIASISNLYPAPGWPENFGTIAGTITHADGETPITGVNVIARNVANPWKDAVSALSGDQTLGQNGPDGRYTFNGLTPGAQYVVYADGIVTGGFSTPKAFVFPGLEEFYNGENESGNGLTDSACEATPITAIIGSTVTANISFNEVERGPKLTVLGTNVQPLTMTDDGSTVVGYVTGAPNGPTFRWTDAGGFEILGGVGGHPSIARDGSTIVGNSLNPADNNRSTASIWQGGTSWMPLPGFDNFNGSVRSTAYSVTNGGATVVGYGQMTINGVNRTRALRWDAATNTSTMLDTPTLATATRASGVSADGSIVYGFQTSIEAAGNQRSGAIWNNGVFTPLSMTTIANGVSADRPVGEALNSNTDGSIVVGSAIAWNSAGNNPFWRWTATDGVQPVAALPGWQFSVGFGVSASGNVITGYGQGKKQAWGFDPGLRTGFIWTPRLGIISLKDFLTVQGLRVDDDVTLAAPISMSASGNRIIGSGYIFPQGSFYSWVLDIPKVTICHAPPGNPNNAHTIQVDFPESMEDHLAHGDTLGPCECEDEGNGNGNGNGAH